MGPQLNVRLSALIPEPKSSPDSWAHWFPGLDGLSVPVPPPCCACPPSSARQPRNSKVTVTEFRGRTGRPNGTHQPRCCIKGRKPVPNVPREARDNGVRAESHWASPPGLTNLGKLLLEKTRRGQRRCKWPEHQLRMLSHSTVRAGPGPSSLCSRISCFWARTAVFSNIRSSWRRVRPGQQAQVSLRTEHSTEPRTPRS